MTSKWGETVTQRRRALTRRALRCLTPAGVAGAAVLLGIALKGMSLRLGDPDLWWHLKTGQIIASRHAIPPVDLFSFTRAGDPWVVQEWGSEVLMHGINAVFGLRGIVAWRGIMLVLIYALVARLILRETGRTLGGWALVALAAFAGSTSWTERPNLFSFLLFVVVLTLARARNRQLWWIVPICALWANLHGMVLLGLGLVTLLALAETGKAIVRFPGSDARWAARLGLVAGASTIASFVNPYGPGLHVHALRLVRTVSPVVTEWASPDFHDAGAALFLALLLISVASLALSPKPADPTDVALMTAFTTLGLMAVRNLPVASIVLGVVAARHVSGALTHVFAGARQKARAASEPAPTLAAASLVLVAAVFGTLIFRSFPWRDPVAPTYPVAALDTMAGPDVRLFTRDAWAGFALYRRWPDVRVDVDTRVDFFGLTVVNRHRRAIAGLRGWEWTLRDLCVTHVLIADTDGLAGEIAGDRSWTLANDERLGDGHRALLYVPARTPTHCPA
ncbi:MAG: hypothetical protein WDA27_04515 [Actinomycetota bacterium]